MKRVSTDMMNNDMQFWLRRQEAGMASLETRMARQSRIENLRDDPIAASHAVRYQSYIGRLERYEKNAFEISDQYKIAEGYLQEANGVLQRLREIAVQGANGIYTPEDRLLMSQEVDQLLEEFVSIANARDGTGRFIFAGDKVHTMPFRTVAEMSAEAGEEVIAHVEYLGDAESGTASIGEDSSIDYRVTGDHAFWAERQQIYAARDSSGYKVISDTTIIVDGKTIDISAGDTVHAIIAKINDSGVPVKAFLDPSTNAIAFEGTYPHQIRMEDGEGGSVLADLGVLDGRSGPPPDNFAPAARVSGGSMFDVIIRLRDSLAKGDIHETGGAVLGSFDSAVGNMATTLARIGSKTERLLMTNARLNREIPDTTSLLAREIDLDMTKAITDFEMMNYTHRASLGVAGRLLPPTLLDFLR